MDTPVSVPRRTDIATSRHASELTRALGEIADNTSPSRPSSPSDHFVPPYGMHDVTFASLRLVVFQVGPRSATPVAHLIHRECSDAEVFQLITEGATETTSIEGFRQDDSAKFKTVAFAKLRAKIEEARAKHAHELWAKNMRDVDIEYRRESATIDTFKDDKERIVREGGKPYHLWPLTEQNNDANSKKIGMSVIISPKTLAELYSPQRCGTDITITTNTEPAPLKQVVEGLGVTTDDNIYPYRPPTSDIHAKSESSEASENVAQEATQGRSRSASIQKIMDAEKGPWNRFSSSQRTGQTQPSWGPGNIPFSKHSDQSNHQWHVDDLEVRGQMIGEWQRRREAGTAQSSLASVTVAPEPAQPPAQAEAGVDYEVVPGMSKTYVVDRDYAWHKEHVERAEAEENQRALERAEEQYRKEYKIAEKHRDQVIGLEAQAHRNKNNMRYMATLRDMRKNQTRMERRLEQLWEQVFGLRKQCGLTGPALTAKVHLEPEVEEEARVSQNAEKLSRLRLDEHSRKDPKRAGEPANAVEPTDKTRPRQDSSAPRNNTAGAKSSASTAFPGPSKPPAPSLEDYFQLPESEGPSEGMSKVKKPETTKVQQPVRNPRDEHRVLTALLADTGVPRFQSTAWQLPSTIVPLESPPQSPVSATDEEVTESGGSEHDGTTGGEDFDPSQLIIQDGESSL